MFQAAFIRYFCSARGDRAPVTLPVKVLALIFTQNSDASKPPPFLLHTEGCRQLKVPFEDLKGAKGTVGSPPHKYPLVKTEFVYEDDGDNRPLIITKEIPFAATELAKLRKDFARTTRELETEYVWWVSLSGWDRILLLEREAEGYWVPGVFLTPSERRALWSLTQRAEHWAAGLNPLERGDPLATTGTTDQLLESVQKVACLQMMYDRELKPNLSSPMLLLADPERMTPQLRGLPDSLKPTGIQRQRRIQNTPSEGRTAATLEGGVTPDRRQPGSKVWMCGEIAQELISCGRRYGPVNRPYQRAETRALRAAEQGSGQSFFSGRSPDLAGKEKPLIRQGIWQLGLQKGIPRDLMHGLLTKKVEQLVQRWSGREIAFGPDPSAPPLVNLGGGTKQGRSWVQAAQGALCYVWLVRPEDFAARGVSPRLPAAETPEASPSQSGPTLHVHPSAVCGAGSAPVPLVWLQPPGVNFGWKPGL
ncbi:uncharacterized protein LOC142360930 [Opisthocomus hoazin]|uniref:uncharacterized protein LOC142360930 n=1 Tax=Opisthocomus hoazin TaxID=30419 RepID=UPI003F52D306